MLSWAYRWARPGVLRAWPSQNHLLRTSRSPIAIRHRALVPNGLCCAQDRMFISVPPPVDNTPKELQEYYDWYNKMESRNSKSWQKRRRSSPGQALTEALTEIGATHATPIQHFEGKLDASYFDWSKSSNQRIFLEKWREENRLGRRANAPRPSLQTVLASYLRRRHHASDLADQFSDNDLAILQQSGHSTSNVSEWALWLTSKDATCATDAILALSISAAQPDSDASAVPAFLPLYILRRSEPLPAKAVQNLLAYAWWVIDQMSAQKRPEDSRSRTRFDQRTLFVLIVRLLRHCNKSLPEGVLTVARLFNAHCRLHPVSDDVAQIRKRAFESNKMLRLLARPASGNPNIYAPINQRAQFDCIQAMAESSPPVMLNREGFRAIAATQLMSKKTSRERDWARLKSQSWPPWKEDKTGLDADKDAEYGTSNALLAIHRAKEAGYASREWEYATQILSGWDIDQSPTIQQRATTLHRAVLGAQTYGSQKQSAMTWAARVKATRTVEEAWAAFLSWKDQQTSLDGADEVYNVMFEKLAGDSSRQRQASVETPLHAEHNSFERRETLPGDARETTAASKSPKERVYLRVPVPMLDDLAEEMRQSKVVTSGRTLCTLMRNAESLPSGIKYVKWAAALDENVLALLQHRPSKPQLEAVEMRYFYSFLVLLCQHAVKKRQWLEEELDPELWRIYYDSINTARHLILTLHPKYPPAWDVFLRVLLSNRTPLRGPNKDYRALQSWHVMRGMIRKMKDCRVPLQPATFQLVCQGMQRAIRQARLVADAHPAVPAGAEPAHASEGRPVRSKSRLQDSDDAELPVDIDVDVNVNVEESRDRALDDSQALLQYGPDYINGLFYDVFGNIDAQTLAKSLPIASLSTRALADPGDSEPLVPTLSALPNPHVLHAYIRVLGTLECWSGMLVLLGWFVAHQKRITEVANELSNGRVALRRCLVAIRAYMEGTWLIETLVRPSLEDRGVLAESSSENGSCRLAEASRTILIQAKRLADSLDGWGGWPSRAECVEYCSQQPPLGSGEAQEE